MFLDWFFDLSSEKWPVFLLTSYLKILDALFVANAAFEDQGSFIWYPESIIRTTKICWLRYHSLPVFLRYKTWIFQGVIRMIHGRRTNIFPENALQVRNFFICVIDIVMLDYWMLYCVIIHDWIGIHDSSMIVHAWAHLWEIHAHRQFSMNCHEWWTRKNTLIAVPKSVTCSKI